MNSVRLVGDGGAEKVEGKGREMSQRAGARSGRSAAVRIVECRMIVEYTDLGPACGPVSRGQTLKKNNTKKDHTKVGKKCFTGKPGLRLY